MISRIRMRMIAAGIASLGALNVLAQTMVGGSQLSLDTTAGDIAIETSLQTMFSLRLSTLWSDADSGTLKVNGAKRRVVAAETEEDFSLMIPANSTGSYDCEWTAGGVTYTRRLVTNGMRKFAAAAVMTLDTEMGVRTASPKGEKFGYDRDWCDSAHEARISCKGVELARGESGTYDWHPVNCNIYSFELDFLDSTGAILSTETAQFRYVDGASVVLDEGTTEIGDFAFQGGQFTSVTIPNSVTNVAPTAFAGCEKIESLVFCPMAVEREFVSESGRLGTSATLIWPALKLDDVENFRAYFTGPSVTYPCFEDGIHLKRTPSGVSVQFQHFEDPYVKCVSVLFSQRDDGVYGYVQYRRYATGANRIGMDFDTESYTSSESGYAVEQLTAVRFACSVKGILPDSYGTVKQVTILDGTSELGGRLFQGCEALESVSIPMSVTNIDATAFAGCKNVKNLTFGFNDDGGNSRSVACILPDSYEGLERVTIVEGTTEIPSGAFAGCASLESVTIPAGVTNVGTNAFSGCEAVSWVDVPSLEDWLAISFENTDANPLRAGGSLYVDGVEVTDLVIPMGTVEIGDYVLDGAYYTSLSLPASLEDFGDNDIRWFGEKVGKDGLWIENGWVLGYIGTAPKNVVIPDGVKGIAGYAFEGQTGIETVEFPESLRYIGVGSFEGCVNLEGLELPEGLERIDDGAFKNCTWIQDVEFPSTLTRIGKSAFENCTSIYPGLVFNDGLKTIEESAFSNCWRMVSVAMSVTVDEVGDGAFYDCRNLVGATIPTHVRPVAELFPSAYANLKSIVIAEGETNMTDGIFAGCGALPQIRILDTIPEISASAFYGCSALEKVLFDGEILAVGDDAFVGCSALQLPILPETVRSIGARAFKGLSQFSEFKFPASLVTIGAEAFSGCSGISAVELPRGLETLGEKAFYGVTKLTAANIPATVTSLGTAAFGGCGAIRSVSMPGGLLTASSVFPNSYQIISSATVTDGSPEVCANLFNGCGQLAQVDLPTSVTNIGANAFLNCSSLTAVGIPGGVKALGAAAFKGCSSITSLSLPQGLTSIADETFYGCSSLGELVIPGSVTSLGARVFSGCNAMTSVSYVGNAPSYVDSSYSGASAAMVSRVVLGTTGWDGVTGSKAIPEVWPVTNSRAIEYWDVITFDVSFYGNGGAPELATVGQVTGLTYALPLEDPKRTGYAFAGWWTETGNGAQVKATDKVAATRPHNLYAHWTPNEYTVAFHVNGGLSTMESVTLQYDAAATLTTCGFYKKNAEFAGWATEKDGPVVYADGAEVKNLSAEANALVTLYAVWTERIWSAADYLGCPGRPFVDSGDAPWVPDEEMFCSAPGSMRSGAIEAAEEFGRTESVLSTTVLGEGSGSFWWKVDCEPEDGGEYYDYALFEIDGVEVAKIAGHVNWTEVRFEVTGAGEHTLRWTFTRDDWDEDPSLYENAAWLDDFVFAPTPVMVAFDGNGATAGEVPSAIASSAGESVTLPDAGTLRNGAMLFEGWLDSDRGETYRGGDAYVVGVTNVTLKAVWNEHVWTLAEILGADNLTFTTDEGDAAWFGDFANTHDGKVALRSGAIGDSQESRVTAMFSGDGELAFWTRTDGEFNRGKMVDYLKVELDGELVFSGATNDWTRVVVPVSGLGEHTVVWTYLKNGSKSVGLDRAWLSEVVWTPASAEQTETRGTPVPVAFEWLETYYPDLATVEEYESAALATGANGLAVWESFVAGLDPTDEKSKFTVMIEIGSDGKPVVTWVPDLSEASGAEKRAYKTLGKVELGDKDWVEVNDANRAGMRFFKVTVELP